MSFWVVLQGLERIVYERFGEKEINCAHSLHKLRRGMGIEWAIVIVWHFETQRENGTVYARMRLVHISIFVDSVQNFDVCWARAY